MNIFFWRFIHPLHLTQTHAYTCTHFLLHWVSVCFYYCCFCFFFAFNANVGYAFWKISDKPAGPYHPLTRTYIDNINGWIWQHRKALLKANGMKLSLAFVWHVCRWQEHKPWILHSLLLIIVPTVSSKQ